MIDTHKKLTDALGLTINASLDQIIDAVLIMKASRDQLQESLQAVRTWYEFDGSVGGCGGLMEESVEPYTFREKRE